ncbi:hypothetical protein ACFE04_017611 [Oxalis oulophora]
MGSEPNSATTTTQPTPTIVTTTTTASPSSKRSRDPEDEVYLDNLHSHKRYLSEIMASSLNGLTVGETMTTDNLMDSPARSDNMFYTRDETPWQYSPMSEDSDDLRFCETTMNTCSSQPESLPTSPVSPYRFQKSNGIFSSAPSPSSYPLHVCSVGPPTCSQSRQRGSDSEGRFPSSPSDICHSADLRRAALLRSVQMRTQPPCPSSSFELPFTSGQDSVSNVIEVEERPCAFLKSLVDERDYHLEECSTLGISDTDYSEERSCEMSNVDMKGDKSGD